MRRPNPLGTIGLLVVLVMGSGSPAGGQDRAACPAWANPDAAAGWEAFRAEQFEGAETAFQEALRRCPDHEGALTGIGYVFLRTGRPEDARDAFLRVIERTPENLDAQVGAGRQ